jgi:hypothetical protein
MGQIVRTIKEQDIPAKWRGGHEDHFRHFRRVVGEAGYRVWDNIDISHY